jgi:hypothetical protein
MDGGDRSGRSGRNREPVLSPRHPIHGGDNMATVETMALDEALLTEMRTTKAAIDELQQKLKDLVTALREQGATSQEIAEALRGSPTP